MATPRIAGHGAALFTHLYELTMLQAYWAEGMTERAVFSLMPPTSTSRTRPAGQLCGLRWTRYDPGS